MAEPKKDKSLLERAEDYVSDSYDEQRKQIPPWDDVGRVKHDVEVGIMKGVYGGVKSLVSGAIDLLRLAVDPVAQREFGEKAWPVAVKLAKETYISKFGTPAEIQDQNERATAFAKDVYTKVKDSFSKDWAEAGNTEGKRTELVTKWISRAVFEIAALFVGAGEAKAAIKGGEVVTDAEKLAEAGRILDGAETGCKTAVLTRDEILAEQAAKEVAEAEKIAKAGEAAKQPAVPAEVKVAEEAAKAARNNPDTIALGLSTYKETITLPNGKVIEAAHDSVLSNFAKDVSGTGKEAATWGRFAETVDAESGLVDWGPTIKNAMTDAKEIHFNLEGMSNKAEIAANPDLTRFKPPSTNWELSTILSDPELLKKTTFYDGAGNVVKFP